MSATDPGRGAGPTSATGPDAAAVPDPGSSPGPWWSSDLGTGTGAVDPDQDPLAAHLAARGLHAVDDADGDADGDGDRDVDVDGDRADQRSDDGDDQPYGSGASDHDAGPAGERTGDGHAPGICGVCPICRGHAVLQERHPDVAAHLADAARSLSAALATFADAVDAAPPTADRGGDHDEFRPIALDDEEGEAR